MRKPGGRPRTRGHRLLVLALSLSCLAGCFDPPVADCVLACAGNSCPMGLSCSAEGLCVAEPGTRCAAADASTTDAGAGADADAKTTTSDRVERLACHENVTCALTRDGAVYCWGEHDEGQLGGATSADPARIADLPPATAITAGGDHVCAIADDDAYCWGATGVGQTGHGSSAVAPVLLGSDPVLALAAGSRFTCALLKNGDEMRCWGSDECHNIPTDGTPMTAPQIIPLSSPAESLVAGSLHLCVVGKDGQVGCVGLNEHSQTSSPDCDNQTTGVCLSSEGVPRCTTEEGVVVRGDPAEEDAPIADARGGAAGEQHTCVLRDGRVSCWGNPELGRLGNGEATGPALGYSEAQIPGDCTPKRLVAGTDHSCALCSEGQLVCWGSTSAGRLGPGMPAGGQGTPTAVSLLPSVVDACAGDRHSCALTEDGEVLCWGANDHGQLGPNAPFPAGSATPTLVPLSLDEPAAGAR